MATKYTLYFTDTSKTPFDLQSYTTNGPESPTDPAIIAGATGARTTLKLWGKGLKEYGEPVFQDLVYMLENFAGATEPVFSIEGQIWYNNGTAGSPPTLPKLLAYNGSTWDAIITANGSSAMQAGKELILGIDPTDVLGAVTKQLHDAHALLTNVHLTTDQNMFMDALDLPTLTGTEVNALIGIGSPVQTQLDDKLSRTGDFMNLNADLTFSGGEVIGLPNSPSVFNAAASRQYVDDQVTLGIAAAGDGVLTNTEWLNNGLGSPLPDTLENTLRLTVSFPGSPAPTVTFDAKGISRVGHIHTAAEISFDNSFDVSYGSDVQSALEKAAVEIELLKTGGVPPSATITVQRIFEVLTSPLTVAGSPIDTFAVQNHFVDDNRISLSVNGVKQYTHTRGSQSISYSTIITDSAPTGLSELQTYEFDIDVDGAGVTTITISATGSPADIITHGGLVSAINTQLAGLGVTFSINGSSEIFETTSSGTGSSIVISDPLGANEYLFIGGSPNGLTDFIEVATAVDGIEGDYQETDISGNPVPPTGFSSYVVFNYDIITGSKIESLLYV